MNFRRFLLAIFFFVFVLSISLEVNADGYELLVKYKKNTKSYSVKSLDKQGIEKIGIEKVKIENKNQFNELLKELQNDPNIEYVEPNIKYSKCEVLNDPYHDDWGIEYINAEYIWDKTIDNFGITVAVIDSGVNLNHPDLVNQLVTGWDFVNNDYITDDEDGHGTLVAQVIGAEANNGFGRRGVAWNSRIMPLKVLDANGDGYASDIADAIIYAADNGAKVINLSLSGPEPSRTIEEAIRYAYNKGVLLVAAAGNSASTVQYPAAYGEVMAVGAINEDGRRMAFSCFGQNLSLVAPGVNIISVEENGDVVIGNGTSFSAPYVSGGAALIWSLNLYLSNEEVRMILESSARDLGSTGFDEEYGYGVLDLQNAVISYTEYFGDFNNDYVIDLYDLVMISKQIGITSGDNEYMSTCDVNKDRTIDLLDLQYVVKNYFTRF